MPRWRSCVPKGATGHIFTLMCDGLRDIVLRSILECCLEAACVW